MMPLRAIVALAVALASGCSTVAPPAARVPPLTALPAVAPNFYVPDARERMIHLARQEWMLFGRPVVNEAGARSILEFPAQTAATHEVQPPMLSRVLLYWYAVTDRPIIGTQGELRPWSAVFISWLARSAGVAQADFPSTPLHWDYIEHALNAGLDARFSAHDAATYSPRPGDLLCAPRGALVVLVPDFESLRRGPWHCDLVIDVRAGELDAIGGNVLDTVALTRVPLDASGHVLATARRPWRVVIEQR